jgi:polyphenol oxidase
MKEVLRADNLKSLSGISHGFYTRAWGDCGLSRTWGTAPVTASRQSVAEDLGVKPDHLLSCYQIHAPTVITVDAPWKAVDRPHGDAMVTKAKGIALGILTADCVPVLFADAGASVIGACHAGWRGAVAGIIENTVAAMEKLGANRKAIRAALGPCIWQNSYEVGPEFPAPFLAENPEHQKLFRPSVRSGHYMFDLPGYATAKLKDAKLTDIEASPADTCPDEARFFSYRRATLRNEERMGSLISAVVIAE